MLNFIRFFEKIVAYLQGKGFGSYSIKKEVKQSLKFVKKSSPLVIDIGGNVGGYSQELLYRSPKAEIHLFEPSKINLQKLSQVFKSAVNVKVQPFALADESGRGVLYSDKLGSDLASLTKRNLAHFNIDFHESEKINKIRFEDYWRNELDSRVIDLVKIDIEGHELFALKGFGEAINATKVIQFEFGGCNIDTRTYFQDFWYFFQGYGFDLYRITPFGPTLLDKYSEMDECFRTTNYIAVHKT